eukprot:1280119-Prymnesium_polylepis.2
MDESGAAGLISEPPLTLPRYYRTRVACTRQVQCVADPLCHGFAVQTMFKVCKFYGGGSNASSPLGLKEAAVEMTERRLYVLFGDHP